MKDSPVIAEGERRLLKRKELDDKAQAQRSDEVKMAPNLDPNIAAALKHKMASIAASSVLQKLFVKPDFAKGYSKQNFFSRNGSGYKFA